MIKQSQTAATTATQPSKQSTVSQINESSNQQEKTSPRNNLKTESITVKTNQLVVNSNITTQESQKSPIDSMTGQQQSQVKSNNNNIISTKIQNLTQQNNKYNNYDPNNISDDEDNSWADELSQSGASGGGGGAEDEYYGEEDGDYGDESINKGQYKTNADESFLNANNSVDGDESYVTKKKVNKRITINVYCTEYDVVKKVAKKVNNFRIKELEEDHEGAVVKGQGGQKLSAVWDISWHDLAITPDYMSKMHSYQKVNHFPGMYVVCRKNFLARNLMKMQRQFPEEYSFFPKTWLLPSEQIEFRNQFQSIGLNGKANPKQNKKRTYIVKPEALSQGKGIFLSRSFDEIMDSCQSEGCVVQRYITNPYLVDDLKFDLRIYVMLYGVNPLRIYFHDMGLARFATEEYQCPGNSNLDNLYMHLTNYAINKNNAKFQQNEDEDEDDQGHKRSLNAILCLLKQEGHDPEKLVAEIKDIIVKTLVIGQPYLSHLYKSCQPEDLDNSMCFQILGFDIILDHKCKPWLLEVNQSPSFSTDSPLDYKIKKQVIGDAFTLLNCSYDRRQEHIKTKKEEMEKRIMTGKTLKIGGEDKEKLRQEKLKQRFDYEKSRTGGYDLIYPSQDEARNKQYECFIQKANDLWDDFTTGGKNKKSKEATAAVGSGQGAINDKKNTFNQVGQRNQGKLQTQTTIGQKRPTQQQNLVFKLNTQKDLQIRSGDTSQKTSAREIMKQSSNVNTVVHTANQQNQNSNITLGNQIMSKTQTGPYQNTTIKQLMSSTTQAQSSITGDDRTTSEPAINELMVESISHDVSEKGQIVNPKLRFSNEGKASQNSLQNPYLIYNKAMQQSQKLRESFQIQPNQQNQNIPTNIQQQPYLDNWQSNPYAANAKKSQDHLQQYSEQELNMSQDMKHNKANSLILQSQQQLLQKSANFTSTGHEIKQNQLSQNSYHAFNTTAQDANKVQNVQQYLMSKTESQNLPQQMIFHHNGTHIQAANYLNRHSSGNRAVINQILQGLQYDQKQNLQPQPNHTSIDQNTRHTPTLRQKSDNFSQQQSTFAISQEIMRSKRKGNVLQDPNSAKTPLPQIQHQSQQQQLIVHHLYPQQQQQQQNIGNQIQNHQKQQPQSGSQHQSQVRGNAGLNLMQYALARNNQQKSGTLIQISSMPIYVGNQNNLFMQSQKVVPDSPNKRTPLPDLNFQQQQQNQQQQQSQTNRNSQLGQQRLVVQQRNSFGTNNQVQATNSLNGKKPSASALSHSPSVRPVVSKGYQSSNQQTSHITQIKNAQPQITAISGVGGGISLMNSFKQAPHHSNTVPLHQQSIQFSLQVVPVKNAMNPSGSMTQGKTLMPKLFDFNMIEDMCIKKQQQNQREIEEALSQLDKQKQQKQAIISGINRR